MLHFRSRDPGLKLPRVNIKMVEVGLAEGPWSLTDHGRRAEMKLRSNVYDLEAWSVLIREAQV